MGQMKRELERREGLDAAAVNVLRATKALKGCRRHEEINIDQWDFDAVKHAYAAGTIKWKAGEIDGTREEFMEAIEEAIEEAGDSCYICDNEKARD